ncbi:MAG: aldehyde dehydrogenase family protein [Sciscionella sp.]
MAASATNRNAHLINGEFLAGSGERIEVVNPATGEVIGTVPAGTARDVDAAVAAARAAFESWAATPVAERAAIVRAVSEGITARKDEIATTITAEMGSPIGFATAVQAGLPAMTSAGVADLIDRGFAFDEEIGNSLIVREPVGVVGAITPWNYPLHQVVAKVAPALAAGCTVVLKPSEVAPLSVGILAEICLDAGVPAGVFNIVHGIGEDAGAALAAHPDIDMVSFTGSTRAGRLVSIAAADTIKRVTLELGGKSANVVLADADLATAVKVGLANCYINGGQTCTAHSRMLVPETKLDEVVELATAAAAKYSVGDPAHAGTRIGPMSSLAQRDRVNGYIAKGLEEGANRVYGADIELPEGGAYVAPTIFTGVTPEMTIAQEEIFGPVLSIMTYTDEDDAVAIANSTIYGLAGGVFAGDKQHGVEFAKRLRTGQVDVNGGSFNPMAPFGGYRQSGNGRELGRYGLEEFLEVKSIQR